MRSLPVVKDNETTPTFPEEVLAEKSVFPQQISWLPFLPAGSHNKEPAATYCDTKQGRQIYASPAAEERRESAEEGEDEDDEEEEEGREEEEEQRPLCSGVLGYPVVRDHTLGLGLSSAPDAQAGDNTQSQTYKGEDRSTSLFPIVAFLPKQLILNKQNNTQETDLITSRWNKSVSCLNGHEISCKSERLSSKVLLQNGNWLRS